MNKERDNHLDMTTIVQLMKYAIVGVLAFLIDFIVFSMLMKEVHYQIANYCGILAGLVVNYILSKLWVFESQKSMSKKEIFLFIGFTGIAFAFTGFGMYTGIELIGMNEKITKCTVAGIVFFMNFLARKYVIFKQR